MYYVTMDTCTTMTFEPREPKIHTLAFYTQYYPLTFTNATLTHSLPKSMEITAALLSPWKLQYATSTASTGKIQLAIACTPSASVRERAPTIPWRNKGMYREYIYEFLVLAVLATCDVVVSKLDWPLVIWGQRSALRVAMRRRRLQRIANLQNFW